MSADQRTEPHVSGDELRAALAPRGGSRRNPVLVIDQTEHAANELQTLREALDAARAGESGLRAELEETRRAIDAARADAIELRAALDAARGDASELRLELTTARAELRERRAALERLASANIFTRRKVINDLINRGLL
jgi:chromosome segregation ATPase